MENIGLAIALANALAKGPTDTQVTDAVDAWLDDHPEATTTVEDGAITNAKLASSFVTPGTAAAYSSSATYAVGDYCFHDGSLYRCITAITTAEAWTAAHWTAAVLGDDIGDLKSAIDEVGDVVSSKKTLDSIAWGTKTYRDIFITGNKLPDGNFEDGLSFADRITNDPVITEEAYSSKAHSLKCFGSVSRQIKVNEYPATGPYVSGRAYYSAIKCRCDRISNGQAGMQTAYFDGTGHAKSISVTSVTDGFVTASDLVVNVDPTANSGVFIGTFSSANADAYVDDVVIIDLTAVFGETYPTKEELDNLYDEYLFLYNVDYDDALAKSVTEQLKATGIGTIFVGAVLNATGETARFTAMKQLFDIAHRKVKDPSVTIESSELSAASKGAVCLLPPYNSAMFENYQFPYLFKKNGDVQDIPASTTKVMSLITGLDFVNNVQEIITIVSDDVQTGSGNYFSEGDTMTIEELMLGMMLSSSNTCAMAFARVCGEKMLKTANPSETFTPSECVTEFVSRMAVKAARIGMVNSSFNSPSGLSQTNLSTVEDMIRMTVEACSYPAILKVWNKKTYTINVGGTNPRTVTLETTVANATLEGSYYIIGGKTGSLDSGTTAAALIMVAKDLT